MKIVLDFDDCIFNAYQFGLDLLEIFKKQGFSEKSFWDGIEEIKRKTGCFNPKLLPDLLFCQTKHFDKNGRKKTEEELDCLISMAKKLVYSDFADFASNFNKEDIILLSYGDTGFQGGKIEKSGVASFFGEIIITRREKVKNFEDIISRHSSKNLFFIDDKASLIDQVKKTFPQVVALKMERPQGRHIETKSKLADFVVNDMKTVKDIIKAKLILEK